MPTVPHKSKAYPAELTNLTLPHTESEVVHARSMAYWQLVGEQTVQT